MKKLNETIRNNNNNNKKNNLRKVFSNLYLWFNSGRLSISKAIIIGIKLSKINANSDFIIKNIL